MSQQSAIIHVVVDAAEREAERIWDLREALAKVMGDLPEFVWFHEVTWAVSQYLGAELTDDDMRILNSLCSCFYEHRLRMP